MSDAVCVIFVKNDKMPYLTHMLSDTYHLYIYVNMGVKRCVRTSGMQTNAIKLLLNGFKSLKYQNTDFKTLYFKEYKGKFLNMKKFI